MRAMTEQQEVLLDFYLREADGDIDLVREALLNAEPPAQPQSESMAAIEGVIRYIREHKQDQAVA